MKVLNEITHGEYKLEQLIKFYNPYFLKMATNFTINQTIKEDLVQEANVSLWQSDLTYDDTKGTTFNSYVTTQARFAMLNYLNKKDTTHNTIFVPNDKKEEYKLITISSDTPINENQTICDTIADEVDEDYIDERIAPLRRYMQHIKKTHRDILEIKYEGYSDVELAEMSGCSKQWIGMVVDSSIKHLQKKFGVPQVGVASGKHTKLSSKERQLREKHNVR
jgi:RNA polymerase sigma factor (sigma-70 family)